MQCRLQCCACVCMYVCVRTVQTDKGVCVLEGVIFFLFPQSQAGARSSHLPPQHDPALVTQPLSQEPTSVHISLLD